MTSKTLTFRLEPRLVFYSGTKLFTTTHISQIRTYSLMTLATTDYISVGGNRNTSAADWDEQSGLLAFGADQNVAIWRPQDRSQRGISNLLRGHNDKVTAVKFALSADWEARTLVTGSADGELRTWHSTSNLEAWHCSTSLTAHDGSINAVSILPHSSLFATAGADATVKVWTLASNGASLIHSITLKPRYIPLAVALGACNDRTQSCFMAVGGTKSSIQLYVLTANDGKLQHELQATLAGHEGWIRSLALRIPNGGPEKDIILASASQDKYVRLWRLHQGDAVFNKDKFQGNGIAANEQGLTSKVQTIEILGVRYSITFEALLVGHEDWIYTAVWSPIADSLQLLTASADNSLTIWEPDLTSGIWVTTTRLGEISGQKGATTATGSAGGFWIGLWSPNGQAVACLGRTGSWRLWENDAGLQYWIQKSGVSGHVGPLNGLSWEGNGDFLITTGADQTTRMHAEWKRDSISTWHEFARPQIHGYNLNCVTCIGPNQFVSGAEEKLLRVFNKPKAVANMMARLCNVSAPDVSSMAEAANMPVLGLSNKAIESSAAEDTEPNQTNGEIQASNPIDMLDITSPPHEDILARHTLWPEHEKLYGHGYEISEVTTNADGSIAATSCKASSVDHAVIRLYSTEDWHEIKPPLTAHSLTVTKLQFSPSPYKYLLSVGRDRMWSVFQQDEVEREKWTLVAKIEKAHSRMILDASWLPSSEHCVFATAGRDKLVKIWQRQEGDEHEFFCKTTIMRQSPITAIAFSAVGKDQRRAAMAVGEETGQISIHVFDAERLEVLKSWEVKEAMCPSKAVMRLSWRPWEDKKNNGSGEDIGEASQLAVGSADASLRIMRITWDRDGEYMA